jgi:hypothetical protein
MLIFDFLQFLFALKRSCCVPTNQVIENYIKINYQKSLKSKSKDQLEFAIETTDLGSLFKLKTNKFTAILKNLFHNELNLTYP